MKKNEFKYYFLFETNWVETYCNHTSINNCKNNRIYMIEEFNLNFHSKYLV